jgi:hypothetical protein
MLLGIASGLGLVVSSRSFAPLVCVLVFLSPGALAFWLLLFVVNKFNWLILLCQKIK